jgi:hypothetical protein
VRRILMALCLVASPLAALAQDSDLDQAAEQARQACFAHDPAALVADSPSLVVQLPGAEPSVALAREQAAALLGDFLASGEEVETVIRAAREVGPGRGYVELQRKYRVAGTRNIRFQILLLSYRRIKGAWTLVEFRVVG